MILTIPYQSPSELPALVEDEHMARLLEYCEGVMEGPLDPETHHSTKNDKR